MAFVSVTRFRARSIRFLPAIAVDLWRTGQQIERAPGLIGGALLIDRGPAFWTLTLWDAAAAMRAYMTAGAHRAAMPKLLDWADEASVAHWEQPAAVLPSWAEADRRMRSDGRASKVRFPAPAHAAMAFPPPRTTVGRPLQPKPA